MMTLSWCIFFSVLCSSVITVHIINRDHFNYYKDSDIAIARYIVHRATWASLATLSTNKLIKGYPFSNVVSMSDGTLRRSSGVPYFYLTPFDFTAKDLAKDNRCTMSVTLEQTGFCQMKLYDPDDPRCARVMVSGNIMRVSNSSDEYEFARNALFTRHPSMIDLPEDHHFFVAKMDIKNIVMLDYFGGPKYLNIKEYLSFNFNDSVSLHI